MAAKLTEYQMAASMNLLGQRSRHSTLGYISPVRFLESWISEHAVQHYSMVA